MNPRTPNPASGKKRSLVRKPKGFTKPNSRLRASSLAHRLWAALDTPVSLSCYLLSKYGEYRQLAEKKVDPLHYNDALCFFLDYQSCSFLSKYPHLDTGIDKELAAKKKFIEAEQACRETNTRFREMSCEVFKPRVNAVLSAATRKIARILGPVPNLGSLNFAFGPGASYGVRGSDTSAFQKLTNGFECTYAFAEFAPQFLLEFPGWFSDQFDPSSEIHCKDLALRLVPGSQLTFVPKNAKTDRPICIEPCLNGLYQKGIGKYLNSRLARFGVNLNDQSTNQRLAQKAYDEGLATVDFSSASDMISYNLVLHLLPPDWFSALDVARCPRYQIEDNWYNFHKFTSMGNAYTFELESLIFYALACSACEELGLEYRTGENLSVYGDDVIIPQGAFDLFLEVSEVCGFKINRDKSFIEGSFYESCGADYFTGIPVRPLQLKERPDSDLERTYYAINSIWRLSERLLDVSAFRSCDVRRRLGSVHRWAVGCVPEYLRVLGPEGYGDGHIVAQLDEAVTSRPSRVSRHPVYDCWHFTSYIRRAARVRKREWPMMYALYLSQSGSGDWLDRLFPVEGCDNSSYYSLRETSGFFTKTRCSIPFNWDWCVAPGTPFERSASIGTRA